MDLYDDVDLLCLDAGNTVIFLEHARLAAIAASRDPPFHTTADALVRAEGAAKIAHEEGRLGDFGWSHEDAATRSWGRMVGTIFLEAGLSQGRVSSLLDALWAEHAKKNLWSLVPPGLPLALARLRATGLPVAIVSNSEGTLKELFADLGLLGSFDLVLDSGLLGIEKPDPRIFRMALDRFGVRPERALHLGDNFATDVEGARAAGVRVALIDPYDHLAGRHADVPRVAGAPEVADALARRRGSPA